jgi:hypothetical protein
VRTRVVIAPSVPQPGGPTLPVLARMQLIAADAGR